MTQSFGFLAVAFLIGAGLSACAGAQTQFFTLDSSAPSSAVPVEYLGPSLRVDAVHIPAALDRPELVRETAEGRVAVNDNDHWAAPLGELLRRVLTQDLAARLPPGKVVFPNSPKPAGTHGLVVDILDLTPSAQSIAMDVSWTVLSPSANPDQAARPMIHQHTLRLTTPSGHGLSANAAELSALTGELANAIATDLMLAPHPAGPN